MSSPRSSGPNRRAVTLASVLAVALISITAVPVPGAHHLESEDKQAVSKTKPLKLHLHPTPPKRMEVGQSVDLQAYTCPGKKKPPGLPCMPVNDASWSVTGNELRLGNDSPTSRVLTAVNPGKASLLVRARKDDGTIIKLKHRIKVVPRTTWPEDEDESDPTFDRLYDQSIGDIILPTRAEIRPEEMRAGTGEQVTLAVVECDDEDLCRLIDEILAFGHDEDGGIAADSVMLDGGLIHLTMGPEPDFEVLRIDTRHGRSVASLSSEENARADREQGDFNGIKGIDPDDVMQIALLAERLRGDVTYDEFADLVPDGVIDEADVAEANARSNTAGNGYFNPWADPPPVAPETTD